ncbi:cytidylyltransferase domain-containing protein [Calditerrivibrio sp.]|jgi:spore coat polysaccharide biosynthesis protein SpsF|uniref:Acylneuraminate cytidylyltransferase n=1 Tax=Calditerrivibrio nitroreducens TaxID=477976 RepID=A0A2J6WH31_9BACT|nr:MAG: acylneuraminate cytidylyltransferase [Calditerrivibrio nitroreducens]
MKIGAIIQARSSSTRLPKKVLLKLPFGGGITVLQQVIRRTLKSSMINELIVATTNDVADDEIIDISEQEGVKWFRGSKEDVLSRYYNAAKESSIDLIVRITSDCPCIDWQIIDKVIELHLKDNADYTSNTIKPTFPHGLDVEVISFSALEKAHLQAKDSFEREHVCPYISTTHCDMFKISSFEAPQELYAPDIRITLDTEEDYALLCAVFDFLFEKEQYFLAGDVVHLFRSKPWLKIINKKVVQKKHFFDLKDELKEAIKILKLQDLDGSADIIRKFVDGM